MPLSAGQTLSFYEVLGPLGAGGMGEVYRARDTRLERDVALKVLPPDLAGDPERMARFEREAKVLAALQHPGIVTVHSVEQADGIQFLTMELVEGKTLGDCIEQGGMPLERFYPLASAIAEAVHAAHKKGVTHRDLKPDNIILDSAGRPKVLDFGLAKRDEPSLSGQSASSSLTGEGRAMGTIPYMAPEALKAGDVDSRSDVFSLGVVLYELLTGAHPFPAEDPGERISSILRDTPALASEVQAGVSPELARLLRRCLEKDPDRRLQTALDLRNELEELAGQDAEELVPAVPTRRIGPVGWMFAVVALAAIIFGAQRWARPTQGSTAYSLRALTATAGFTADPHWSPGGSGSPSGAWCRAASTSSFSPWKEERRGFVWTGPGTRPCHAGRHRETGSPTPRASGRAPRCTSCGRTTRVRPGS